MNKKDRAGNMRKIGMMLIAIMVVSIGLLSGCTEDNTYEENTEIIDTDGDGYPDNEDDFPNDLNLHKKIIWYEFENRTFEHNTFYPYEAPARQVSTNTKYVEWEWSLINPPSYDAKIEFMVKRYTQYKLIKLYEKTASADSDRIAVDYSNVGTWTCTWYYTEEDYGTLYLSATVYAVE